MNASRNTGIDASRGRSDERNRPRRPPPRPVEVVSVEKLTPRLVSVRLGGELGDFEHVGPTAHLKVYVPDADGIPVARTYTPRHYDRASGTLEVLFVIHGPGPASQWAAQAKPGDCITVGGPAGRYAFDPTALRWWIAGDESALPAIGTLLDALPGTASAEVHVEVDGPEDEIALESGAGGQIFWHHRRPGRGASAELEDAARTSVITKDTRVWVACETTVVRRIRRHLLEDRDLPLESTVTRGYWRLGLADYHD
jgi:NADPH-dependent ferric siderophore reductase